MDNAKAPDFGQAPTNAIHKIPRYVQYTSPVSVGPPGGASRASTLPLNLVGHIVSYLDDIADIARVTRTSRLLYYMTLPQLYRRVHLHSYGDIRYVNGVPEGFGSGSPFVMAINGLITKQHGALVQDFRIWGEWKEMGIEDFAKGRVPDNSMMLNILVRAATDRMVKLHSFCWELDCKPLKTVYQGLASHHTLTSLTLRFPSTRIPRPAVLIPPIPSLRAFRALDIDPLCNPDDISLLLSHSSNLEDVRLHFSPRMRQESEASVYLETYFGRCISAGRPLRVKHFGMQNFFGRNNNIMDSLIDPEICTSVAFIDTFGGPTKDPRNVFIDETWKAVPAELKPHFIALRANEPGSSLVTLLRQAKPGLERFYVVSERRRPREASQNIVTPDPMTPDSNGERVPEIAMLKGEFMRVLTTCHGLTLRHLLLSDQWALNPDDVGELVRSCPNLQQVGLALDSPDHTILRLMLPFLAKLKAVRVLKNEHLYEHLRIVSDEERKWQIGVETASFTRFSVEHIGVGDLIYKVGNVVEDVNANGEKCLRREITHVTRAAVKGISLWGLDFPDINLDPVVGCIS